jgi:TetR/AcrR family transcriptional regulator
VEKDTRTKLIEAATPLFAKHGFVAVSIRQLAQAAGVNIAAVSYHFRSKEGLYQAVLEEQFRPIAAIMKESEGAPLSAEERLTFYARNIANIHRQRPYFIRFMASELTNPTACLDSVVKKYISRVFRFLSQALTDGIAAGQFAPGLNLGYAALSLAGIMNFYFIARPIAKELLPLSERSDEEYTAQALSTFLDGIRRRDHE